MVDIGMEVWQLFLGKPSLWLLKVSDELST
jgi:hypothetical protein